MIDTTIIYITSNREDELFESKIKASLLEAKGDLPIISVSQKPIDFGTNICLGDIGARPENVLLQLIIGARNAATKFIAVGESDFLYPNEFFKFIPPRDDTFYYPGNAYIIWKGKPKFYRKQFREMLSVTNREHFIKTLETVLNSKFDHITNSVKTLTLQDSFYTDIPLITFKTKNGLHWKSPYSRSGSRDELPYWGTAKDVLRKYLP